MPRLPQRARHASEALTDAPLWLRPSQHDRPRPHRAARGAGGARAARRSARRRVSGTSRQGREELGILLTFLQPGDELVVTRVDRLARSIGDLQDIVRELRTKKVALVATEQPIDTSTAAGKAFLDMLGVFAEFETNLRRERQMEGIAKAKAKGVYKGREARY